jgi:hypothetical protein
MLWINLIIRFTKQYIQDLIIDTATAVTHLDTKILIVWVIRKYHKSENQNITNILHKTQLHIIKQIHRKQIKIINKNKIMYR